MNLTKKLLQTSFLIALIAILTACSFKTLEPKDLKKAEEIRINGKSYLPEFNGLDPYLLAQEELVLGKQENWYIHNDKLYLFVDKQTREEWFTQMDAMQLAATQHWEIISAPSEEEKLEDITDAFMNGAGY